MSSNEEEKLNPESSDEESKSFDQDNENMDIKAEESNEEEKEEEKEVKLEEEEEEKEKEKEVKLEENEEEEEEEEDVAKKDEEEVDMPNDPIENEKSLEEEEKERDEEEMKDSTEENLLEKEGEEEKEEIKEIEKLEIEVEGEESRRWTELEIADIRCTEEEQKIIPNSITNPLLKPFWAFVYCWMGNYYLVTHGLWQYLLVETGFCICCWFSICCVIPCLVITLCILIFPLIPLGSLYFSFGAVVWWISEIIVNLIFMRGMKRVSYVEEHKMKGSKYPFRFYSDRDTGKDFNLLYTFYLWFLACCAFIFKRIVKDLFLVFIITVCSFVVVSTLGFGLLVVPFIIGYVLSMSFGFNAFSSGYLNRRYTNYFGMFVWGVRNHLTIAGYGFAALLIYFIPGLQLIHYFFGSIGATRFAVHVEEQKKLNEEKNRKKYQKFVEGS